MNANAKQIFGVVAFILGVIILFFIAIRYLTSSRTNNINSNLAPESSITDYANPRSTTTFTKRGRIIAEENHFSWVIEITESQRSIEVREGYLNSVVARSTYPNNKKAYEEFIYALARTGIKGVVEDSTESLKGICARGTLSTYLLREGSDVVLDQWHTTCGVDSTKTYKRVEPLFINQIPDFNEVVRGVKL